jgi:chorismate--pyruvate lyase
MHLSVHLMKYIHHQGSASDEETPSSRSLFAQGDEISSPFWRLLLLSDGSVTRHLQLLTGSRVKVECLSMVDIGESLEGLPPGAEIIPGPRVERQVLLQGGSRGDEPRTNLVYACSWWNADRVDEFLKDKSKPIWVSLSEGQVEIYREIQYVHQGHNESLEEVFKCKGPFFGRRYIFWHQSKPLCLIYEVFSPKLSSYILA